MAPIPRKCGDSDCSTRRSAVWKICFEDFVHPVVVVDGRQVDRELQNAVHAAATCFDQCFNVVHYLFRVCLNVHWEFPFRVMRVRTLTGDINHTVVDNQRSDETRAGGFSFIV